MFAFFVFTLALFGREGPGAAPSPVLGAASVALAAAALASVSGALAAAFLGVRGDLRDRAEDRSVYGKYVASLQEQMCDTHMLKTHSSSTTVM